MKTSLTGVELRRFFARVEVWQLESRDRPAPTNEVEKVAQRAQDFILKEFRDKSTSIDLLANAAQNLAVLESCGEDAPEPLVNSVRRATGQRVKWNVEYSSPGGYIRVR